MKGNKQAMQELEEEQALGKVSKPLLTRLKYISNIIMFVLSEKL